MIFVFNFNVQLNVAPTVSLLVRAQDVLAELNAAGIYLSSNNAKIDFSAGEAQLIGELKADLAPLVAAKYIEDAFNAKFSGQALIQFISVYEQTKEATADFIDIVLEFLPAGRMAHNTLVKQYSFERMAAFLLIIAVWLFGLMALFYFGFKVIG